MAAALLVWSGWLAVFGPFLRAQAETSWLDGQPTLGQREEVGSGQLPESVAFAGNIPCTTTNFTTRPPIPPLQQAEVFQACAVTSAQGRTASGGFTNIFKTDAKLYNSGGGSVTYYAVPGGLGGVVLENTAQGQRLHYYSSGLTTARKNFNPSTREMKVYMPTTPSWTLKDKSGRFIHVRPDSLSFSNNGQWMVVDSPLVATMLVDLATGRVVPFSSPYVYHVGLSVTPHTAVSDNGRTVVTSSDRGDFKMTDVTSCANVPNVINGPVNCNSTSHEAFLRSQISGYHRIYQVRFLNDRRLGFYASYNTSPSTRTLAKFRMAPAQDSLESQDYLALGDSFASGEGTYDYFPETDTKANMCHLSRQSYPYLIGRQLSLVSYNSVACSGARIQDITTYVQKQSIPSPNNLGRLLPGYKRQIQYVHDQNPNVTTVSIGGNDIGFGDLLKRCVGNGVTASTCYESYEDRLELVRQINSQFDRLVDVLAMVKSSSKKNANIYAVGYPRIAKLGGNCAVNVRLDDQEVIFAEQVIDYLNKIIELSAAKAGVHYTDVADAFNGYRLCEIDGRNSAMNGLTAGTDSLGLIGNESYHPNQLGHQLYKLKILQQTNGFLQTMPTPNPAVKPPPEDSGLAILNAAKANRTVKEAIHDENIADPILIRGESTRVQATSGQYFLQPNSSYSLELHSTPLKLGTFMTDDNGNLSTSIDIGHGLPTGFHSLHIFAKNIVGKDTDIHKTVYVAASRLDFDGDGIANTIDELSLITDSPPKTTLNDDASVETHDYPRNQNYSGVAGQAIRANPLQNAALIGRLVDLRRSSKFAVQIILLGIAAMTLLITYAYVRKS